MNRRLLIGLLAVTHLIIGAVGFGIGRGPARVEYRDKVVTVEKQLQTIQQKVDIEELKKLVADIARKNNVVTTRETVKAPDGTTTTRVRTEDRSETTSHTETSDATHATSTTDTKVWKETVRVEEHVKLVESRLQADWAFEVDAGYQLARLWGADGGYNLTPTPGLVLGASAFRRILGPIWLGAWANTTATAGAGIRLVF